MLLSNAGFSIPSWQFRPATSGGKRGRYPLHFFENRKKVPWFCKKVPWFWKNVSWCASIGQILIKNAVLRASSRKKDQNSTLRALSFVCHTWNVYQNALIPRNLPCPEKFLVAWLQLYSFFTCWKFVQNRIFYFYFDLFKHFETLLLGFIVIKLPTVSLYCLKLCRS